MIGVFQWYSTRLVMNMIFSLLRKLRKHAQMMRTMSWNFMIYLRYTLEVLIHPVISRLVTSYMLPILSRKTSNLIITCLRMHAQP